MNSIYKIITEGENKGRRLYDESLHGGSSILPCEINLLFKNALDINYKIFVLNCSSNHIIKIPQNDLNFIGKSFSQFHDQEECDSYEFSNEVLKIKNLQCSDLNQFYNLAVKKNEIGSFFIDPFFENGYYCFDICLIVKNNFNLNDILNMDFNLIRIKSFSEYTDTNIDLNFFRNLYNIDNTQFKDFIVSSKKLRGTRPYDYLKLPEVIEYNNHLKFYIDFLKNNPNSNCDDMEEKSNFLQQKVSKKEYELWDVELYKSYFFSKLCMHFLIFDEILLDNSIFFTNFLQIMGGVKVDVDENNGIKLNYEALQPYFIVDLFDNDPYGLYSVFHCVYHWGKK